MMGMWLPLEKAEFLTALQTSRKPTGLVRESILLEVDSCQACITKGSLLLILALDLGCHGLDRSPIASGSSVFELELELSSADIDGANIGSTALVCRMCDLGEFGQIKSCFIPS
jgi:hypothetical protein